MPQKTKGAPPKAEGRADESVLLADQPVEVELAGRKYVWPERGRRDKRQLLVSMVPAFSFGENSKDLAHRIESSDRVLDFFYANHPGMKEDKQFLDDNAEETEISDAFTAIHKWAAPEPAPGKEPGEAEDKGG